MNAPVRDTPADPGKNPDSSAFANEVLGNFNACFGTGTPPAANADAGTNAGTTAATTAHEVTAVNHRDGDRPRPLP